MINEIMNSTGAVITGNRPYSTATGEAWAGASPFDAPALYFAILGVIKTQTGPF